MTDTLADLGFSFSISSLIAGILFGIIGWWMFRQGRRRDNTKVIWIGVTLMIYPYFVNGAFVTWSVGVVLCAIAYYYRWD